MVGAACELLSMSVRSDARAPATVREALATVSTTEPALGDAMLIASELVTNAVRHSGADAGEHLAVSVARRDQSLLISVTDPGHSGKTAQVPDASDGGFGGLGLRIVEELTTSWGQVRGNGYRVWAEIPLSVDPGPRAR